MSARAKSPARKAKQAPRVGVVIEDERWRARPEAVRLVKRAARQALSLGAQARAAKLTILLADDARLAALNRKFRRTSRPTNVLSFPAGRGRDYLGDVAIAYGMTAREARESRKRFAAHAAHLAAHGVLHLLGYDHWTDEEADVMEDLEARALARLALPDPYGRAAAKARATRAAAA